MIRIEITSEQMKHIVPVEDWRWEEEKLNPPPWCSYSMYDRLVALNGCSPVNNLRRAHHQLKDFLSLAVKTAKRKKIPLSEVEIISSQLLDFSAWGGYIGAPWDADCNWDKLMEWFEKKYGKDFVVTVDTSSFSEENKKSYQISINFSKKTRNTSHSITC